MPILVRNMISRNFSQGAETGSAPCADISPASKRGLFPAGDIADVYPLLSSRERLPPSISQDVVFESYEKFVALPSGHKCSINSEVLVIGHHSGEVEYIIAKVDWITRCDISQQFSYASNMTGLEIAREPSLTLPRQILSQAHATAATKSPIPLFHLYKLLLVIR